MTLRTTGRAFARVGLMGNPGDALGGPGVAFVARNWRAEAIVEDADCLRLSPPPEEDTQWPDLDAFLGRVARLGYAGGQRLMMALVARLARTRDDFAAALARRPVSIAWNSTIPPRVGLAGSSALIVAALNALADHYAISIAPIEKTEIAWKCETDELGIPAGPLDRAAQAFDGLVFMENDGGRLRVEALDARALPPLFLAIDERGAEGTEVFHSDLRERFGRCDSRVTLGVEALSELARRCRDLLSAGRGAEIAPLMDHNFETRRAMTRLNPRHVAMIDAARRAGAHAKFAGSGGAIVGTCPAENIGAVMDSLQRDGYTVARPVLAPEPDHV